MTDGGDTNEYYRVIEEEFNRRRGAPMLLSPRDWALIGEWRAAGVPLRVAVQGIANVFETFVHRRPTARRINSLSYCRQEVLGLHEVYLGLRGADAGRPPTGHPDRSGPAHSIHQHLGRLGRRVRETMTLASESHLDRLVGALAQIAADLKRMRREARSGTLDLQRFEDELRRFDDFMLDAARDALASAEMEAIEQRTTAALADRRLQMTDDAYAATQRALLVSHIRQRCRLPRLTLFD